MAFEVVAAYLHAAVLLDLSDGANVVGLDQEALAKFCLLLLRRYQEVLVENKVVDLVGRFIFLSCQRLWVQVRQPRCLKQTAEGVVKYSHDVLELSKGSLLYIGYTVGILHILEILFPQKEVLVGY